jgi:hypothetical protein
MSSGCGAVIGGVSRVEQRAGVGGASSVSASTARAEAESVGQVGRSRGRSLAAQARDRTSIGRQDLRDALDGRSSGREQRRSKRERVDSMDFLERSVSGSGENIRIRGMAPLRSRQPLANQAA